MGQYASVFIVPESKAVSKQTHPSKANWITSHAIAAELSIAEVERLWVRFQQLGCNRDGDLTEDAIRKSEYNSDVFMRNIIRKFMTAATKKVPFENFLRALKWCEQSEIDEKIRGIYCLLNNGNPVDKDLMGKILERVYPDDRKEAINRLVELFYQVMDPNDTGQIGEAAFVTGVQSLPSSMLESVLDFQILPEDMKERLHKNLLEFRTESATGQMSRQMNGQLNSRTPIRLTPGRGKRIPTDQTLREVAEKIHRKDWPRVANKLGFFSDDVRDIQDAYSGSSQQQVYQLLRQWRERDGNMAYSDVLEKALQECGMFDAAILLTGS